MGEKEMVTFHCGYGERRDEYVTGQLLDKRQK